MVDINKGRIFAIELEQKYKLKTKNIMGYTHNWEFHPQYLKKEQVDTIVKGVNKIISNYPTIKIVNGLGEKDTQPHINTDYIRLNGCEKQGYETFHIDLRKEKDSFNFCKTAHRDYDIIICQILILLSETISDVRIFSFDSGGLSDKYAKSLSKNDNITIEDIENDIVVNDSSINNENYMHDSWKKAIIQYHYYMNNYILNVEVE